MRAVIVTGTREAQKRDWFDAVFAALDPHDPEGGSLIIIHGACGCESLPYDHTAMKGIDRIAHNIGQSCAHTISVPMPAPWRQMGKAAGPFRNMQMANVLCALREVGYEVAVLAFHDDLFNASKGTLNMVNRATFAKIPWAVYDRNGTAYGEG